MDASSLHRITDHIKLGRSHAATMPGRASIYLFLLCLAMALGACSNDPGDCPGDMEANYPDIDRDTGSGELLFRFPLDGLDTAVVAPGVGFQVSNWETRTRREFHAAEDYLAPAGTAVYAIADGIVRYSGTMGGYGWLVIVDHPLANLYSLYGHLSPSRWQVDKGPVVQGELLGYLGDEWENGGSREKPLRTHLHLGIRAGQRADYPTRGEWRWMAGWITPCPSDIGWQKPSAVLSLAELPEGGFTNPQGNLLEVWAVDILLGGFYLVGAAVVLITSLRKDNQRILLLAGLLMAAAGIYFTIRFFRFGPLVLAGGILFVLIAGYRFLARQRHVTDR